MVKTNSIIYTDLPNLGQTYKDYKHLSANYKSNNNSVFILWFYIV